VILDYHMHLRDPDERVVHTLEAVERFVETASARGVDEIGFTEHVYYFHQTRPVWTLQYQTERCVYDLDMYVDVVLEAKHRGLPVKLGLEVDYVGERQDELAALLEAHPWDYLLGSVHWIDGQGVDQLPGIWAHAAVDEVWRRYFAALLELASSGHVDVLAHPDLAKIFGNRPDRIEYPPLDGVALEISTAGLRKPVGEIYPSRSFLEEAVGAGLPVALSSDAHTPDQLGFRYEDALELLEQTGVSEICVFEGRQRRLEPVG
jgi:histidinol-phosphatase (PHP family)